MELQFFRLEVGKVFYDGFEVENIKVLCFVFIVFVFGGVCCCVGFVFDVQFCELIEEEFGVMVEEVEVCINVLCVDLKLKIDM